MIKSVLPIYTGSGIYVFLGSLSDGTYFISDSAYFDARIIDSDPTIADEEEVFLPEWQEKHLIRDLEQSQELYDFIVDMLNWIIENRPDGNYNMGEIELLKTKLHEMNY